jgi:hypothetical protein
MERALEAACIQIGQVTLPPGWETSELMRVYAEALVRDGCYEQGE